MTATEINFPAIEDLAPELSTDANGNPPAKDGFEWVRNARFGGFTQQRIGTPWSCSVASESYWCS